MKAREVRIFVTSAALQAERMLAAPAEKLIIAGTRPLELSAKKVAAAAFAFGSITPIALPGAQSGISLRARMLAPITRRP